MSDRGVFAPPATLTAPADERELGVRPLLEAYRRVMTNTGGGAISGTFAKQLAARHIRKDLATLRVAALGSGGTDDDRKDVEQLESDLPPAWKTIVVAVGVILALAQLIISLTVSVAGTEQLLERSAEVDLTNPFSIVALVRVALTSSLSALVFFAWTVLASASLVLLPVLRGARRYRLTFCRVALDAQRRTWRRLGLPAPSEPMADLRIAVVPVLALLFLGIHLFLMAAGWPVDDGRQAARITGGAMSCAAFAMSAIWLATVWRRRRPVWETRT